MPRYEFVTERSEIDDDATTIAGPMGMESLEDAKAEARRLTEVVHDHVRVYEHIQVVGADAGVCDVEPVFDTRDDLPTVYPVQVMGLPTLDAMFARLAKRAEKLGVEPASYEVVRHWSKIIKENIEDGYGEDREQVIPMVDVVVHGSAPKIAGWTLAAVIEPVLNEAGENVGNVLRAAPGIPEGALTKFREATNECDHCHTRRARNETFVVMREDDAPRMAQVGRQCLRDFLGHASPDRLAAYARDLAHLTMFVGSLDDDANRGGRREIARLSLPTFLNVCARVVSVDGFRSRKAVAGTNEPSTSDAAWSWYFATGEEARDLQRYYARSSIDATLVAEATDWLNALLERESSTLNDYEANMSTVARANCVEGRTAGLAASALGVALRARREAAESKVRPNSEWVGTLKKRQEMTLTLRMIKECAGYMEGSTTYLHLFTDAAGNNIKWFASGSLPGRWVDGQWAEVEIDATVTVKATPVRHEEYKGRKCTIVNRVALV